MSQKLILTCDQKSTILVRPGILIPAINICIGDNICFDDQLDLRTQSYAHFKLFRKVKSIEIDNNTNTIFFCSL